MGKSTITSNTQNTPSIPDKEEPVPKKGPSNKLLGVIFGLSVILAASTYYSYGLPQLFEDVIIHYFQVTPVDVGVLYAMYSLPNFVITPLGSLLLSSLGLGTGIVIFNGLVFFGTFVIAFGFYFKKFFLVILGRGIFGVGAEVAAITQATISERWFKGKMLSVSLSFNRVVGFLVISSGVYLGPELFIRFREMGWPLLLYGGVCAFCFFAAVIYWCIERAYDKQKAKERRKFLEESSEIRHFKPRDVKKMSGLFWLLALTFAIGSQGYMQFMAFSTDCIVNRFGFQYEEAKNIVSVVPILCMVFLPILSVIVLWIGKKSILLLLSMIISAGSFYWLSSLSATPTKLQVYIGLGGFAFYYSLFVSCVWPSMSLSVPSSATAAAFGLAITVQNVFLTAFPVLFGYLNKERTVKSYNNSLYGLVGISVLGGIFAMLALIVDLRTGKKLHIPENDRRVSEMRSTMEQEWYDQDKAINEYKSLGKKSVKGEKEEDDADIMDQFIGR